ncbi:alpha/beta fold hydrolase [Marinobacter orientalis]|uniref:Alpha/beta hydrolase n=1 Tax=Marinobacter orientalis TaxID=1928859 RepID=A0A7Y0RAW7_9GAMM|nr:alpha/beta hydrolase [Marinobacter orientalis]NMT62428.1 alpha/beta hydrolase [Marinobacter orientalis]TGX51128.1 alpha/beta hydrolase [Marinobacter orientalis]
MHWILLRGLTREQSHWGKFPRLLADAFPGQHFHLVDLPGTGVHFNDPCPESIAAIRERVRLSVGHIPGPYSLLGLSIGGMVALDWAQHALPGEIQNLVLINTSSAFSRPWHRMKPRAWPRIVRLLSRRELFDREADILRLSCNRPVSLQTVKHWYSIQRQRPVSFRTAWTQLKAAATFRPVPDRPLPDALLLASEGDRIVHWQCSKAFEQRWQWTLKVHPSAGHDLPLDDPQWIIRQMKSWLPR